MDTVYEIGDLVLYQNKKGEVVEIINGITTTFIKIDYGIYRKYRKTMIVPICDKSLSQIEKNHLDMLDVLTSDVEMLVCAIEDVIINAKSLYKDIYDIHTHAKSLYKDIYDNSNISADDDGCGGDVVMVSDDDDGCGDACDTCGGICSWEHIPPAILRESILKNLISYMSHNKVIFNSADHKKQIVFELADLFKIFMQHQPTHALFKAILTHNLHASKTLRGLLSLNQLFDLLTKHVPAEFKIPVSFMLDGVAVLNIESALDDLAEKKPEVKQTLKEYRELVRKAQGVRTTEIDTLIKALLKIKLLFWYDDYAKNNVDNRNTIMQMVLALYPDRDNDTSMAEFYAYKHFYSLSTGYSKNDKGFNSAMKNILKQFKELEEIIEVVPMMDGIAFYKFFGISSTKSHVTKYRGKWTNLQKNPEFLPCNSRHNERMKDVISKLGTPTFDINNSNHNQLCKCGCYDFEVDDLKWKQAPLSDHTVPIAAWETVGTASLTSEFFMDKISTMLNAVKAKNNKGRFEQFGRDSGISGTNIDRLYKMLEISDALKKAQEEGLDTTDLEAQFKEVDITFMYKDRVPGIQGSIVGWMHCCLFGGGKSGILAMILIFYKKVAVLIKQKCEKLSKLGISWLKAIKGSNVHGTFAIFQADEILTILYFWCFIMQEPENDEHERLRKICYLLTSIYGATTAASEAAPLTWQRHELTKGFLGEFDLIFDHGRKTGTLNNHSKTGAYAFNKQRDIKVKRVTCISRWWRKKVRDKKRDFFRNQCNNYETDDRDKRTFRRNFRKYLLAEDTKIQDFWQNWQDPATRRGKVEEIRNFIQEKAAQGDYKSGYKFFFSERANHPMFLAAVNDYRYIEGNDRVFEGYIRKVKQWAKRANTGSDNWPQHVQDKYHLLQKLDFIYLENDEDDGNTSRKHYKQGKKFVNNGTYEDMDFISGYFDRERNKFFALYHDGIKVVSPLVINNKAFSFNINPNLFGVQAEMDIITPNSSGKMRLGKEGYEAVIFVKTWEQCYVCVTRRLKLLKLDKDNQDHFEFVEFYEGCCEFCVYK